VGRSRIREIKQGGRSHIKEPSKIKPPPESWFISAGSQFTIHGYEAYVK
jgi:hypothetical protein